MKKEEYQKEFDSIVDKYMYPDFPKPGVNFMDIFPIVQHFGLWDVRECMRVSEPIVLIPEARGFIFYGSFGTTSSIPLRKAGKLPCPSLSIDIEKEYGKDTLYLPTNMLDKITSSFDDKIPAPLIRVAIFDDLLATGGTAEGIIDYINQLEYNGCRFVVTTCSFYVELTKLGGRERLQAKYPDMEIETMYHYDK